MHLKNNNASFVKFYEKSIQPSCKVITFARQKKVTYQHHPYYPKDMKCPRFSIESLKNEEWAQYYASFRDLVVQFGATELDVETLFTVFLLLYARADEALELVLKSVYTRQLNKADIKRGSIFRGFVDAVKSARNHFDITKREAAGQLQIIIDHYGNISRKPADHETAAINNFIQDMKAVENAAAIELLGLEDWLTQLSVDNKAFDTLMKNRDTETAQKTNLRMKSIRTETDRCYRGILDRIDALMIVNGEEKYIPFVKELTARVDRYSTLLAHRKSRSGKPGKPGGKP